MRWLDDIRLALVLAPPDDDLADDWTGLMGESFELEAPWDEVDERSLDLSGFTGTPVPFTSPRSDLDSARADLQHAASRAGHSWTLRRAVWSVVVQADGSVLAACEGSPPSGGTPLVVRAPRWRNATAGTGSQLTPQAATTALTTVEIHLPPDGHDVYRRESEHDVIDVETGVVSRSITQKGASIIAGSPDSVRSRSTGGDRGRGPADGLVIDSDGAALGSVTLSRYDLFNHWFDIKRAPAPLILVGNEREPHKDKWVTRIDGGPAGAKAEPLFPLDWQGPQQRHLFGGPGAFVDDESGTAVIHCGEVHAFSGSHSPFAVRRSYPSGTAEWIADLPGAATGADEAGGIVAITTSNGWLLLLDSATGRRLESTELLVSESPVVPLSVSISTTGQLAVGLLDGRILRLARTGRAA